MKKGEKIIQIIKEDAYYIALTNKGNILGLDFYLDGGDDSTVFYFEIIKK